LSEIGSWADHEMVRAACDLGPAIDTAADQIESGRRLPDHLVEELTRVDIFQMYLPKAVGGPEVHPLTAFAVCDELARHDGSLAWCVQVAAAVTSFVAWIDPDGLAEMVDSCDKIHLAGSARPLGEATMAEGGFTVKGHWNYASGVLHSNWFLATSFTEPPRPDGPRRSRSMFVPVTDGAIVDNWDVMGMRGTGSNDFVLDDVFIPERRAAFGRWIEKRPEPLYNQRLMMAAAWAPTAGVATGLARGAIDALAELGDRSSAGSPVPLRERTAVQDAVAQAEAITRSARAFVVEALGHMWDALLTDSGVERAVADAHLAITHAMNEAVRVVDIAFHAAGTNAISTGNRLERFLRDTHTGVQHASGQHIHQRAAGRQLMGLDPVPIEPSRVGPAVVARTQTA
jgi:indole-3-acetate monooxygenase